MHKFILTTLCLFCYSSVSLSAAQFNQTVQVQGNLLIPVQGGSTNGPAGVVIVSVGGNTNAYVCNFVGQSISVIDVNTNTITATITDPTLTSPYNIAAYFDGITHYAYVCNSSSDISIINLDTNMVIGTISGASATNIAIDTPNKIAYAIQGSQVYVIDLTNPTSPTFTTFSVTASMSPRSVAVSPDGLHLYLGGDSFDPANPAELVVVNTANTTMQQVIPVPSSIPSVKGISVISNTKFYAAGGTAVAVVSNSSTVTSVITNPQWTSLYAIGFDPVLNTAYVTDFGFQNAPLPPPAPGCPQGFEQVKAVAGAGNGTTVSVINTLTDTVSQVLGGFFSPQAIAPLVGKEIFYVLDGSAPRFRCTTLHIGGQPKRSTCLFPSKGCLYSNTNGQFSD